MTDIVERLRTFNSWEKIISRYKLTKQAADEIERLRAALRAIADQNCLTQTHDIAKEALGDN